MVKKRELEKQLSDLQAHAYPELLKLDKEVKSLREQMIKIKKSVLQIFDHLDKMLSNQSEQADAIKSHADILRKLAEIATEHQYVPPKKQENETQSGYA